MMRARIIHNWHPIIAARNISPMGRMMVFAIALMSFMGIMNVHQLRVAEKERAEAEKTRAEEAPKWSNLLRTARSINRVIPFQPIYLKTPIAIFMKSSEEWHLSNNVFRYSLNDIIAAAPEAVGTVILVSPRQGSLRWYQFEKDSRKVQAIPTEFDLDIVDVKNEVTVTYGVTIKPNIPAKLVHRESNNDLNWSSDDVVNIVPIDEVVSYIRGLPER